MNKDRILKIKDKLITLGNLNEDKIEYLNGYIDAKLEKKEEN